MSEEFLALNAVLLIREPGTPFVTLYLRSSPNTVDRLPTSGGVRIANGYGKTEEGLLSRVMVYPIV